MSTGHFIGQAGRQVEIDAWVIFDPVHRERHHFEDATEAGRFFIEKARSHPLLRLYAVYNGAERIACPYAAVKPVYVAMSEECSGSTPSVVD